MGARILDRTPMVHRRLLVVQNHQMAPRQAVHRRDRRQPVPAARILVAPKQLIRAAIADHQISKLRSHLQRPLSPSKSKRQTPCHLRLSAKNRPRRRATPRTVRIRYWPPFRPMMTRSRRQQMHNRKLYRLRPQYRLRRNSRPDPKLGCRILRFRLTCR